MEIVLWVVWAISLVFTGVHAFYTVRKKGWIEGASHGYDVGYEKCLTVTRDFLIQCEKDGTITFNDTDK